MSSVWKVLSPLKYVEVVDAAIAFCLLLNVDQSVEDR